MKQKEQKNTGRANRRVSEGSEESKEDWIGAQCEEIETCLKQNRQQESISAGEDLTSEKQGRSSTIQDKSGKCLT